MSMARSAQRRVIRPRRAQRAVPVLSHLAEIAPVGMMVTGLDGAVRYLNPAFTRLLGYSLEGGASLDGFALLHHEDTNAGRQHLDRLARGESLIYRGEHMLVHADGHPLWVMLAAALSRDSDGQPDCIITQITSIELQKRAEEALAYSENRWNFALEGARQGVWDHDIRKDTMFYSRMWRRMRGIPDDEVIGRDHQDQWVSRLHPDDVARVLSDIPKQDRGDEDFEALEYRERSRDGRYIWILSRGQPVEWDEDGNALRTIGTDTDITYLKTIEQELAAEKERLRVTLHAIADGMIATDAQGRVTFINPAAERFTGYSADEAKGLHADTVFPLRHAHTDEAAQCPAMYCLTHKEPKEVVDEVVLVSRDGQTRDIRCSASPVLMPDGKVTGAVLIFQDVTQSRALQRQLVHSASHDDLTGLPNRVAFDRALSQAITSAQDNRRHCLLYIDLDRFKPVNDNAGHAAGDALLKQVAETIRGTCRGHDLAARLGGDEFAVLLEDCPLPNGLLVAQKIVRAIGSLIFTWGGRDYRIGASIGVAAISGKSESGLGFLAEADAACYAAKAGGRSRAVSYQEMAAAQSL